MKEGTDMKKILSFLLSLALILSLVCVSCPGASAARKVTKVITGKQGASLRSTPEIPEVYNANKLHGIHADEYLEVFDECNGWYYVKYKGEYGWVNASPAIVTVVETEEVPDPVPQQAVPYDTEPAGDYGDSMVRYAYLDPYDMGVPQIGENVFTLNQMNLVVLWVQTQLKATGAWYQGDQCELSGCLTESTMAAISGFMEANGFSGHAGNVDQNVINTLQACLGNEITPVLTGGFYNYMAAILSGDPYGSMDFIVNYLKNPSERVTVGALWVQTILAKLGYYTGSVDGIFGQRTQEAVTRFRRNNGFVQTDTVSLGVARTMIEQYYRMNGDMLLLP